MGLGIVPLQVFETTYGIGLVWSLLGYCVADRLARMVC
jgi:hypothetical protein